MSPELVRLAETCHLTPAAARDIASRVRCPVVAARILSAEEVREQYGIATGDQAGAHPTGAIWLPVPSWSARDSSAHREDSRDGLLAIRYIGDGLPVIVLALTSEDADIVVAVLLWDTCAMRWLGGIVERQEFILVLEPADGGEPGAITGRFRLAPDVVRKMFEFEFSVEESERGHALRAAALMAIAATMAREELGTNGTEVSKPVVVGVVTRHVLDLGEMAALQTLGESTNAPR